jgi:ribonuclease HII
MAVYELARKMLSRPDRDLLSAKASSALVVGIDEVGRGALAGPVVVVAVIIPSVVHFYKLKDSKKLSARQRELWYAHFLEHPEIIFAVARVYSRQIEKRNISGAANLAALRAYKKLVISRKSKVSRVNIYLDGGLFLKNRKWQTANIKHAQTIVKADEKITAVKIASIIAKVHRDDFMRRLAKKFPEYGLEIHKGYGTKAHRAAIKKHGPSAVHRLTFIAGKYRMEK